MALQNSEQPAWANGRPRPQQVSQLRFIIAIMIQHNFNLITLLFLVKEKLDWAVGRL